MIQNIINKYFSSNLIFGLVSLFLIASPTEGFSQVDTEFWFVVPELSHRGNTGGTPATMRIATMELAATVTISMPANPYHVSSNPTGFQDIVIEIAENSSEAVDLSHLIDQAATPLVTGLENKPLTIDGINDFGLHITSTNMITAYWEINYDFGSDLWTLKGSNGLGTLFFTPFQTVYDNRKILPRTYSAIDIVATQDDTEVTITLPPGKAASYGSNVISIPPGGTHSLTLEKGQTFSIFPFQYSIVAADHLAGTKIEASKDIAVTVKDDAIASGSQGQDLVGDQLVPVDIIGDNYIVPEIGNPNHVYVLAAEDNTNIYVYDALGIPIGATPYLTLNSGEQGLVIVPGGSQYVRITSRLNATDPPKPFYTFQMGLANQSRGGAIIPSIGCTGNTQVAFTRARSDNKFYFFIIVEKGNEDKFLIDGFTEDGIIDPDGFTEIANSGGWVALFSNTINSNTFSVGQHLIKNTGGIFHLGILNGFPGASQGRLYYGYYSDFGGLNIGANVAGTNSLAVRACYGDPVQLYAFGGTNYLWTPDNYLDDGTSNLPTALNLPPGPHNYSVEISGACATGTENLTVLVSTPVKAFFETNVSSGCSPLEIQFDDLSTGTFSWQYDLGDGTPLIKYDLDPITLDAQLPPNYPQPFSINRTYINNTSLPIEYNITLLVKNESGCSDILEKTIIVFPEIESDFSIPVGNNRGCEPLLVQFQNNSLGDTATWLWEFGDGGSSIEENPQHTFTNLFGPDSLVFETRLIAISPYYCRDTSTIDIAVMPYIEANFAFDTVSACSPHEITITDQSFGADSYAWDFGDGDISNSDDDIIFKTYINNTSDPITYTIHLRVDNKEGCFSEIERDVTVYPEIDALFIASQEEGCSPFDVEFFNNSTGAFTYLWDFGDGGTSTEIGPIHHYDKNNIGHDTTYYVSLIATSEELCVDTAILDILVHPYIEAVFTVEDIIGCGPFNITINNQSVGADQYFWDFGDGSPVSNTSVASFDHLYLNSTNSKVVYTLQLIVLNEQGCRDTLERDITVHPEITANFTTNGLEGCHPFTLTFTNISKNAITYYWEFGDGVSSLDESPEHTYNNFSSIDTFYTVSLTTSTADGECIASVSWQILVHPNIEAEFAFPNAIDCGPFEVVFENLSIGGLNYNWDFGDGITITTTNTNPVSHTFINNDFSSTANYTVSLLVDDGGICNSETSKNLSVYPNIYSEIDTSVTEGCHPLSVDFKNLSNGGQTYIWDYGDGSSSNLFENQHIFTNTGTVDSIYTVELISISPNNICRDTFSFDIRVHPYIKANFSIPENLDCNPFDVLIENSSINASIYRWNFGDNTDTITYNKDPIIHRFYNASFIDQQDYLISMEAENYAGCLSQIARTIWVEPDIIAEFSANQTEGCHPLDVNFTNLSKGAAYYHWDFGNGTTSQSISTSQTFENIGSNDTTYSVWLYAWASNNTCLDSFNIDITVRPYIRADFAFMEFIHCSPSTVQFNNASVGGSSYYWDFGDGTDTTTTDLNPVIHVFNNSSFINNGEFQVSLTVDNLSNCTSTMTKIVEVYPAIETDFSINIDEGCHPLEIDFTNNSDGGYTYIWDFGDGASSDEDAPDHIFTNFTDAPITRQIQMIGTSRFNCIDSINAEVIIHPNPKARIETDIIINCPPFDLPIINNSINADHYVWTYGDGGSLDTNSKDTINHIYYNENDEIASYELKLIANSNYGCVDSAQQKIYVYPSTEAIFSSNQEGCNPFVAYFMNESVRGDSYLWDFGDGTNMTVEDPTNVFFNFSDHDTIFYVSLISISKYGCIDSTTDSVFVYPQPSAEFLSSPTHQTFPSSLVNFTNETNEGPWTYYWEMGDGFSTKLRDPSHTYMTWGDFEVKLIVSSANCSDVVSHTIHIFPAPPIADFDTLLPGCEPHRVSFTNNSIYADSYLWDFDDGTNSNNFEPIHTYDKYGFYNVKLTVTGEGGRDYAYRQVEVYRKPEVDFRVAPELVMLPDEHIQLFNLSKHGVNYLWDLGDGGTSTELSLSYLYSRIGVYDISLDVWTEHGCTNRLVKPSAATVMGKGLLIFPNAFKPDRSGPNGGYYNLYDAEKNNVFHPYWEGVEEYRLQIYSRWGELLFTSEDVNIGWDGYHDGKIAGQGVYVWRCKGSYINGQNFNEVGDVTLLH